MRFIIEEKLEETYREKKSNSMDVYYENYKISTYADLFDLPI
jgi:hypothetical protein